jgi:hypothetical protein
MMGLSVVLLRDFYKRDRDAGLLMIGFFIFLLVVGIFKCMRNCHF